MHDESMKALYDFYPAADKNDFFSAYLYLKHTDHFIYQASLALGVPAREPEGKLDESIAQMMTAYIRQFADTVPSAETSIQHGKLLKTGDALKIVNQKRPLRLHPSERVVPFKIARDVILENPGAIALGTCYCRAVQQNPCLPPSQQKVCLILGDPFASFIAEHNPGFRRASQEEAVHVIEQAHKRGEVQCAYFKKDTGNRLVEICNCCPCCCLGMKVMNLFGGAIPFLAPSGYVSQVNDSCDGCGACVGNACPFGAISMDGLRRKAVVDQAKCMGCGVCEGKCPIGAISLRREPAKGEPLDVDELKWQGEA